MVLVSYSDSEGSDSDSPPVHTPAPKKTATGKQPVQKIVNHSNPSKIRVNLPSTTETNDAEERPSKKPRLGGSSGLLSQLNSFLPAPKRSGATVAGTENDKSSEKKALGKGRPLGRGVNLKTGAAPAFSREAVGERTLDDMDGRETLEKPIAPEDVEIVGKATMFKPLSVANKTKKKKIVAKPSSVAAHASISTAISSEVEMTSTATPAKPKPKVSLFSISQDTIDDVPALPVIELDIPGTAYSEEMSEVTEYYPPPESASSSAQPQSLSDVAGTMNLSASSRRQLFGRHAKDASAINIINFDTDVEYAANEELRASGESVQHNPLRTIQPGRHTLRQLVSVATSQQDALEEKWAEGKAKQNAAGNRYGWR
jgi:hypothetical protein